MRRGSLAVVVAAVLTVGCGSNDGAAANGDVTRDARGAGDATDPSPPSVVPPAASAGPNDGGPLPSDDAGAALCGTFPSATDLTKNGAFSVVNEAKGSCTIYRPADADLGKGGVTHPVILWGNGTGTVVSVYAAAFELWASHGFIVAAANASNGQGAGTPLTDCLDAVNNAYAAHVCAARVGASGHSQGGGGAIMAGRDARVFATAPVEPYIQQGYGGFDRASITAQHGAMLLLSGSADDNAVPSVHQKPVFDTTNAPVFWATLNGGDHYLSALGLSGFREIVLAWFRLELMGDASQAPKFFGATCTYCTSSSWSVQKKGL